MVRGAWCVLRGSGLWLLTPGPGLWTSHLSASQVAKSCCALSWVLESLRYDDDRTLWEKMPQQRGEERLGGGADAAPRQHSPLLQTPGQGLHGGSFRDSSEQFACRCDCQILRQAGARSQAPERRQGARNLVPYAGRILAVPPECARPRAQRRPQAVGSWKFPACRAGRRLLRPRTGALRPSRLRWWYRQDAPPYASSVASAANPVTPAIMRRLPTAVTPTQSCPAACW